MFLSRAYDINREILPQLIKDLQNQATMLYMVDHKENKRQIFPGPAPVGFKI